MKNAAKSLLGRIGAGLSSRTILNLGRIVDLLETGHWIRAKGYRTFSRHPRREGLYELVLKEAAEKRTLYLEFGVFEGAATRWWAQRLKHPDTRLIGFDTFQGLPETWNAAYQQGHFSVEGRLPKIDDPRVSFQKGLFSETLPDLALPEHDLLVLNMDADLYSSTAYVLNTLRDRIVVGTYIYFDEFSDSKHELRAFDEFLEATGWTFELLGVTEALTHAVFRRAA